MADSQIFVTLNGDIALFRIVGEGTFRNADYFKKSYSNLLLEGVDQFVFDLAECTLLDSTFLGTMLGLGLKQKEAGRGSLHILNASAPILELLKNLGLDRLMKLGTDSSTSSE